MAFPFFFWIRLELQSLMDVIGESLHGSRLNQLLEAKFVPWLGGARQVVKLEFLSSVNSKLIQ